MKTSSREILRSALIISSQVNKVLGLRRYGALKEGENELTAEACGKSGEFCELETKD